MEQFESIEAPAIVFQKDLDTVAIDTLYKAVRAKIDRALWRRISMMTSRTYKEQPTKWQRCAAMYEIVCSLGLTSSALNMFGGRLGQETSIDSRHIRQ